VIDINKQMTKRKRVGLTLDILILISVLLSNDIQYLKFIGMSAILLLIGDTILNKL